MVGQCFNEEMEQCTLSVDGRDGRWWKAQAEEGLSNRNGIQEVCVGGWGDQQ